MESRRCCGVDSGGFHCSSSLSGTAGFPEPVSADVRKPRLYVVPSPGSAAFGLIVSTITRNSAESS